MELKFTRRIGFGMILSCLLVGSFGGVIGIPSFENQSRQKTEPFQYPEIAKDREMMRFRGSRIYEGLTSKVQTSGSISEGSEEFMEGKLENVTLNEAGAVEMEKGGMNYEWKNISVMAPSDRYAMPMVFDSHSQKGVLFGGDDNTHAYFADTWVYELPTNTWTQMNPSTAPPKRRWHTMAYDSDSHKVILFGGEGLADYADTWVYELLTNIWTEMNPPTGPDARLGASMVYDSNSRKVILFGGLNTSFMYTDDTWAYDLLTNTWTEMKPSTAPSGRAFHRMVYDSSSAKVILFGGDSDQTGFRGDTWVYDLLANNWTELNPQVAPSARAWHGMAYDTINDKVILFGGSGGSYLADTWIYDLDLNNWTSVDTDIAPNPRWDFGMVCDPQSAQVVLFGGFPANGETWILSPKYALKGRLESKITSFGNIYEIMGNIGWAPSDPPVNTSLKVQVGLSNTTNDLDFVYTSVSNSSFPFEGLAQFLRYRVFFESDETQDSSPVLDKVVISFTIENPRPQVRIISPQDNSTVAGVITIAVSADAPNGIDTVFFYVGGRLIAVDESIPFGCSWDSTISENGAIPVVVIAVSALGRQESASIQLQVENPREPGVAVPSAPIDLSATAGENFVTLSWAAPTDDGGSTITQYRVYRGTTAGEYRFMGITMTGSFNDTLVQGNTTYYYVVTAMNAIGESGFSIEVSVTPTGLSIPKSSSFPSILVILSVLYTFVVVTKRNRRK